MWRLEGVIGIERVHLFVRAELNVRNAGCGLYAVA